jgi:hypothetical protein
MGKNKPDSSFVERGSRIIGKSFSEELDRLLMD